MAGQFDSILDELFHGCALAAFVEQSRLQGGWPDLGATRLRAYKLYEADLAAKNGRWIERPRGPDANRTDVELNHD